MHGRRPVGRQADRQTLAGGRSSSWRASAGGVSWRAASATAHRGCVYRLVAGCVHPTHTKLQNLFKTTPTQQRAPPSAPTRHTEPRAALSVSLITDENRVAYT